MCVGEEDVTLMTDIDTENDHNFQNRQAQLFAAKVKRATSEFVHAMHKTVEKFSRNFSRFPFVVNPW